jgi:predicted transcriptional regulator
LAEIAAQRGVETDKLAAEVLTRYLQDDRHFIEAVNLGLSSAEQGDFVEHEEVGKALKKLLHP